MTHSTPHTFHTAYFGKIASRGDFVRNNAHPQLIASLDGWLADTMELVAQDPHWKGLYDEAQPLCFAFLGPRSKLAVAGHLRPSRDQAGRRFPFLCATSLEIAQPLAFIGRSPVAFGRVWNRMERAASEAMQARDATAALQALNELDGEIRPAADDGFDAFVELQTLARIEQMLQADGHGVRLHDLILALGILLQPVMSSGSSQLEKGLALPLPDDPLYQNLVAAYWMHLIAPFLARADFELACFLGRVGGKPRLLVGFSGAAPHSLAGLWSAPSALAERYIVLDDAPWVGEHIRASHGLAKLSSYLDQPRLSLRTAHDTFRDVFIGA